ncbi:MAG: hypothetical protein Q8R54_00380 [Methylobacter sp.]|nr:hypothetical protein [Methylobacter sp.]
MKIKNYRLFILGFVTVSFVLLTGFQKPGVKNALLTKKQAASVNVKEVQFNGKNSAVKSKDHKTKNKHSIEKNAELQKSLDLTVPFFKASENAWLKTEQNRIAQIETANIFANEHKKKLRSLDLDGQMLMSQEPEADKRKSLDGAAIVINLKR